jgi:glycosyltransferase involved in cell wall biosynthesis
MNGLKHGGENKIINGHQLLIAHDYPPILGPESIQSSRMISALADEGWETTVLTAIPISGNYIDKTLNAPCNIVRSATFESNLIKGIAYVIHPSLLYCPDTKITWYPMAVKAGRLLLKNNKFDIIHSWASPFTSHLVALKLKKEFNIKWVAHFSDPWVGNPYFPAKMLDFVKNKNIQWEKAVVENADALVFTCEETVDMFMNKYQKSFLKKTFIIPHTFDPSISLKNNNIIKQKNKVLLSHIGNFYGPRTPEDFLNALSLAMKIKPSIQDSIQIRFTGKIQDKYIEMAKNLNLTNIIQFKGFVDYKESIIDMIEADVLINIDAPSETSIFLPSKLVEYFGLKKPIIGITSSKGTTARILNKFGHIVVENKNHIAISEILLKIAEYGTDWINFNSDSIMEFLPQNAAKKHIEIFNML